jgi:hypothetical protein
MKLKLMYELFAATNQSLRELQKAETAIIQAAALNENNSFVHAGVLALAGELRTLWDTRHQMDRRRAQKWFWQIDASDVEQRSTICESARGICTRLWALEQGLFGLLPVEFVQEVQASMSGKRAVASGSKIAPVRTVGGDNVRTLPESRRKSNSRNPAGHTACVLKFRR